MAQDDTHPGESGQPAPDRSDTPARRRPGQSWSDLIEEKIRDAERRGLMDHLPGAGKPIEIDVNPYAGDNALGYSLLRANNLTPREIDLGREIDADLARAEALLARLREKRDELASLPRPSAPARQAYSALCARTAARYEEMLREIRSQMLTLNIIAPPVLHRRVIDVDAMLRAFHQEFPPLAE